MDGGYAARKAIEGRKAHGDIPYKLETVILYTRQYRRSNPTSRRNNLGVTQLRRPCLYAMPLHMVLRRCRPHPTLVFRPDSGTLHLRVQRPRPGPHQRRRARRVARSLVVARGLALHIPACCRAQRPGVPGPVVRVTPQRARPTADTRTFRGLRT